MTFGADPIEMDAMAITDSFVQHMLASTIVVNKYSSKNLKTQGLGGMVGNVVVPPIPLIEAGITTVQKIMNGEIEEEDFGPDGELSRAIPAGVGELLWHVFGTGQKSKHDQSQKRIRENRERARNAGL